MKILFLAVHAAERAPGQRFRFEQYLPYLRQRGVQCDFSGLLDGPRSKVLYSQGNVPRKALLVLRSMLQRSLEIPSLRKYDVVFVQREALFIGAPVVERAAKLLGPKLVYDFDDAIWINDASAFNKRFAFLKTPTKVPRIAGMADLVIAGNAYLADFARRWNPRVAIVPTTIDTDSYVPRAHRPPADAPVCIGWSGSFSTIAHFKTVLPALRRLAAKYGPRIRFKVIGDASYKDEALGITGLPWKADTEVADLQEIDIGLMPLPDDQWARGKCGLKGLQYMALGIPTLMSPVGVNSDIIEHGKNGYLPATEDEWVQAASALVDSADLRAKVGDAGRRRVEEGYSLRAWRDRYYDLLVNVAAGGAPLVDASSPVSAAQPSSSSAAAS